MWRNPRRLRPPGGCPSAPALPPQGTAYCSSPVTVTQRHLRFFQGVFTLSDGRPGSGLSGSIGALAARVAFRPRQGPCLAVAQLGGAALRWDRRSFREGERTASKASSRRIENGRWLWARSGSRGDGEGDVVHDGVVGERGRGRRSGPCPAATEQMPGRPRRRPCRSWRRPVGGGRGTPGGRAGSAACRWAGRATPRSAARRAPAPFSGGAAPDAGGGVARTPERPRRGSRRTPGKMVKV